MPAIVDSTAEIQTLEAHAQLALTEGRLAEAIAGLRQILELDSGRLDVANQLAAVLLHCGCHREAIDVLRSVLAAVPDSTATWLNLGVALKAVGDLEGAAGALGSALFLEPDRAEAHYNLGSVLQALGSTEEALAAYLQALALQPGWALAHNRLGSFLQGLGRNAEARECFARAAALEPAWHLPHHNLGQVAMGQGESEQAILHFRDAVRCAPDFVSSHLDMGAMLLQSGAFEEGWRELEWRFGCGGATPRRPGCDAPVWDGSPLGGRTVMVWIEQGLGDNLQFVRYLRGIHERGGRAWLQAPGPLLRLYDGLDGIDRLVAPDEEVEGFDLQVPLMSLPRLFGTTVDSIPAPVPYLTPPPCDAPALLELAREERRGFRVGIVWASAPGNPAAGRRDCDVEHFVRLAGLPGVTLYSFQFGERAGDLLPQTGIVDLSGVIGDFATTAAFVQEMDLILTVDTAMAHLAGALGRRVWTLLSEPADWRWLRGRDDSPWYPTMRLFRQRRPGDWTAVFDEVEQALGQEIAPAASTASAVSR